LPDAGTIGEQTQSVREKLSSIRPATVRAISNGSP
jgi:hypothetical protein